MQRMNIWYLSAHLQPGGQSSTTYDYSIDHLRSIASSNVKFTTSLSNTNLVRHMQTAEVHVQVSEHKEPGRAIGWHNEEQVILQVDRNLGLKDSEQVAW